MVERNRGIFDRTILDRDKQITKFPALLPDDDEHTEMENQSV